MRLILLISFCFCLQATQGQDSLSNIDVSQVRQKKIRLFIHKNILANHSKFTDLHVDYNHFADSATYRREEQRFLLKEKIANVWNAYMNFHPQQIWNGKLITYGLAFSGKAKKIFYPASQNPSIDTGEIIFLNLRLLSGTVNLAIGIEVTSIDSIKKCIEFCYINGNISRGIQRIQLITTPEGYTQIIHTTLFKSHSAFRDRFIYPFFHRKTVNEFHKSMSELVYAKQNSGLKT